MNACRSWRIRTRRMAGLNLAALLLLALAPVAAPIRHAFAGQDNQSSKDAQPDLKPFLGTWTASFQGKVFAILALKEHNGKLYGTLNNFDVGVDKDGNLTDETHADSGDAPLLNARFRDGALLFLVIEKDQYHPSAEWKFVPKTTDEGELTPILDHATDAPKDMVVKPIRMTREHAKQ